MSAIDRLLVCARAGQGGGMVLRGEPGIGKSALLEYARLRAPGACVLTAAGAAAESGLGYAVLQQLLSPVLHRADGLPGPQAAALRAALGLEAGDPPDPFLVSLAVLTLLSETAAERTVLCLADDLQWADQPSVDVLAFVARRLRAEPVVLLAADRRADGADSLAAAGLSQWPLTGLDPAAAAAFLDQRATLAPAVRDTLVRAAGGNPLALIELPGSLSAAQLAGAEPLPEPLPLPGELERVFAERITQLEPGLRAVTLVCAAEGAGRLETIRRAVAGLDGGGAAEAALQILAEPAPRRGVEGGASTPGQAGGVVRIEGSSVVFRHPLMRSAAYYSASPAGRRAAHRALAGALAGDEAEADRRAWHLASAAFGPDEEAATELERSAERTLRRSGYGAAAAALERAAALSTSSGGRYRRLAAAADAAWRGGDAGRALALLGQAEGITAGEPAPHPAAALRLRYVHGLIELRSGVPADGLAILLRAGAEALTADPHLAVAMLMAAGECAFQAGDGAASREVARLFATLAEHIREDSPRASTDALIVALYLPAAAMARGERTKWPDADMERLEQLDDPDLLARAGGMAFGLGRFGLARRLRVKAVSRARATGAGGMLAWALRAMAMEELAHDRYAWAGAYAAEGLQLALETGQPNLACQHKAFLAGIAAVRGQQDEARRLAAEVLADAAARGLHGTAALARGALVQLALAGGQTGEALANLEALWAPATHRGLALHSFPDLAEAAVRAGVPSVAARRLDDYLAWAGAAASAEAAALAARARALLADAAGAGPLYAEALRLHAGTDRSMDQARTELLYGEFLRRNRSRAAARGHLRAALDTFERLDAAAWAQRARAELRATGETVRTRAPTAADQLTHQELQVARVVSQGLTNREAAAQLFISPRTVDHHLRGIYRKLGITTRAELVRLILADPGVPSDSAHPGQ